MGIEGFVLCAALTASVVPVSADDAPHPVTFGPYVADPATMRRVVVEDEKSEGVGFVLPGLWHASLQLGDGFSSEYGLSHGGAEVGFIAKSTGVWPAKAIGFTFAYAADLGIQAAEGRNSWQVWAYRIGLAVGYGIVIQRNLSCCDVNKKGFSFSYTIRLK